MRKKTIIEFVNEARRIHGDKYDYSHVVYNGTITKVTIICPKHGEFYCTPSNHIRGAGCNLCRIESRTSSTSEFVAKCKQIYGDLYDYSKTVYENSKKKLCVICPKHGEFWVTPNNHLRGSRCPECYGTPKKTVEEFIEQAKIVHGNKFDYSKVEYKGTNEKVCIVCPEHGDFWQTPKNHLRGIQCPACSGVERIDEKIFLERSLKAHGTRYDYSKAKYTGYYEKVCIICPEHGEFWQKAEIHMRGYGCPICGGSKRLTTEEFIEKANIVHKGRYSYLKTSYVNTGTKVCITCREHGDFWQTPNNHLFGAGCPACIESQLENKIRDFLIKRNVKFEAQKTFSWLIYRKKMFLDFFLPDYSIAIECQGRQHFESSEYYGGEETFALDMKRDEKKKLLCEKHGIKVLYYSELGIKYPYEVFERTDLLWRAILYNKSSDTRLWKDPELPFVFED